MVGATAPDDYSANEITDIENVSVFDEDIENSDVQDNEEVSSLEDEDAIETSHADIQEDLRREDLSEQNINADADLFSSELILLQMQDSETGESWTPLTTLTNENRILYRYDESEKILYFKCTEPIALPDYNYGNRTDWFVDLGSEKFLKLKKIGDRRCELGVEVLLSVKIKKMLIPVWKKLN